MAKYLGQEDDNNSETRSTSESEHDVRLMWKWLSVNDNMGMFLIMTLTCMMYTIHDVDCDRIFYVSVFL